MTTMTATFMQFAQLGRQLHHQQAPCHSCGLNLFHGTVRRSGLRSFRVQRQGRGRGPAWERKHTCVAQAAASPELEEIDPMTGQVVEGTTRSAVAT